MGEVLPAVVSTLGAKLGKIADDLRSAASLNWERVLTEMQMANPNEMQRTALSEMATAYVQQAFRLGQFKNLEGINPVLQFLGINSLEFTDEHLARLRTLYARHDLPFLYSMSPTLYNGKLADGTDYDKVAHTRRLLQEKGARSEELTDEYIRGLWDAREILVRMHRAPDLDQKLIPGIKLAELTRLLQ